MKRIISLLALLTLAANYTQTYAGGAPLPAADHWILVHFDQTDDCPVSTRVIASNGGGKARCQSNGKAQADAVCVADGDVIEWRPQGNNEFYITNKSSTNPPLSNCAETTSGPPNRYRCTVAVVSGNHHYNIETDSCLLDPRIILN